MVSASDNTDPTSEVIAWLREHLNLQPGADVTCNTRINMDLGVDGDDGAELIQEFGEHFQVDTSPFPIDKYFGPEAGISPFALIWLIYRWIRRRQFNSVDPLRVADLVAILRSQTMKQSGDHLEAEAGKRPPMK